MSASAGIRFPRGSPLLSFFLIALLFLGGGVFGVELAEIMAPDSILAQFVGLFLLPLSFAIGMQLWLGFALLMAIGHLIVYVFRKKKSVSQQPATPFTAPPGAFVFLPVSLFLSVAAGILTAIVSSLNFFLVFFVYICVGAIYGTVVWMIARSGYLPLPESM